MGEYRTTVSRLNHGDWVAECQRLDPVDDVWVDADGDFELVKTVSFVPGRRCRTRAEALADAKRLREARGWEELEVGRGSSIWRSYSSASSSVSFLGTARAIWHSAHLHSSECFWGGSSGPDGRSAAVSPLFQSGPRHGPGPACGSVYDFPRRRRLLDAL